MIFYKTSSTFVIFFQNITLVNEDIQFKFWHKTAICFPKRKTTLGEKKKLGYTSEKNSIHSFHKYLEHLFCALVLFKAPVI